MPRPNVTQTAFTDARKLQLARLERNSPADYQRVIATLSAADKTSVLSYIDGMAGKPLPPLPNPGKVNIGTPGPKK